MPLPNSDAIMESALMTAVSPEPPIGRLTPVDIKASWPSEASDFTPWLACDEPLSLLGDTLGLELEFVEAEKGVGPFRADIVARDTADGSFVLIENQLERTDHTHLGQILTYAPGLDAVTIVWVACRFREEHRAALDWLNENTNDKLRFFGLEIELWQIGNSPPAPKFNVVCKPNDWVKGAARRVGEATELTPTKLLQFEFWQFFSEFCDGKGLRIKPIKPAPQHWMTMAVGRTGFSLTAVVLGRGSNSGSESGLIRAEFNVLDARENLEPFLTDQDEIHSELGFTLSWHNPESKKAARAWIAQSADISDRDSWQNACQWLTDHLEKMHEVFGARLRSA